MTLPDDDRDLRERFASLRREEEPRATPLDRLLQSAAAGRVRRRREILAPVFVAATVLAALALVIGQALYLDGPTAPREPPVSLAAWTEPTAFLLRTPGHDLLSTVPAFMRDMPAVNPDAPVSPPQSSQMKRSPSP